MKSQTEIIAIADSKLSDAEFLFDNKRFESAYYIGGYAVELLLKARVCKTLGIDDFFLFKLKSSDSLYKPYKVHDLFQLLILSGLYRDFEHELKNPNFKQSWSLISQWNEGTRYLTTKNEIDVKDFLISILEFSKWIKKHL